MVSLSDHQVNLCLLVTGGAGFIGSNITNTLSRDKNATVVAFDALSLGIPTNLSCDVKFGNSKRMLLHYPFCGAEKRSRYKCFKIYERGGICQTEPREKSNFCFI